MMKALTRSVDLNGLFTLDTFLHGYRVHLAIRHDDMHAIMCLADAVPVISKDTPSAAPLEACR